MVFAQRFSLAAALGCGFSYAAGAYLGWILPPDTFWVSIPVLYYGSVLSLYGSNHRFRWKAYKDSLLGASVGILIGLFSIARVNYDHASFYQGMNTKEVRYIEGTLQQDGYQKGTRVVLRVRVQAVEDRMRNRHSARFDVTAIVPASGKFLAGDRVRLWGIFPPEAGWIFYGDAKNPPGLLHRPFLALTRSKILGNIFHQNGEHVALLKALCFGIKDGLKGELSEAFRKSGTSHILALSGMHVGILVLVLQVLLSPLFKPLTLKVIISFFLVFYCVLVGPFPSLVRAVLMYCIYTITLLLGRRIHPLDLLSHTFTLSCFLFPSSVLSYSSILSYTAVGGIFLLTQSLQRYFRRFLFDPLLTAVSVSLSAQIVTAPLTLYFFSRLPLYGWIASILLSPLISLFMWIGLLSIPAGGILFLDPYFQGSLKFLYTIILYVAEVFAKAPALQVP